MTDTLTARLSLTLYGDRTVDGPTMGIENGNTTALENLVCIGALGPFSVIPAAGKAPRIYLATDQNAVYFDNGTGWVVVGTFVLGTQTVQANAGQTASLQVYRDGAGSLLAQVDTAGTFIGHFKDIFPWASPAVQQANWGNAAGYYYGATCRLTGETAQVRGQFILNSPGNLILALDARYIPLNTQRFPVWVSGDGAWDHGSWAAVAQLTGYRDATGQTAGLVTIYPATGPIGTLAVGAIYDLNMVYTVGSPGIITP